MELVKRRRRAAKSKPLSDGQKAKVHFISWKITISDKKGKTKIYDFSLFAEKRPKLARSFMNALCSMNLLHSSRLAYMNGIRVFWRFLDHLDARDNSILTLSQIDSELIKTYILWLEQQRNKKDGNIWNINSQRKEYGRLKELLRWLLIHYRNEFPEKLIFPRNVYRKTENYSTPREAYSKDELSQIVRAIEAELEEVNIKLENRYVPQNIGRDPRVGHRACYSLWRSLDNVAWYFEHKLNCKKRTQRWLKKNGHYCFVNAAYRFHGGLATVWKKLSVNKRGRYLWKGVGTEPKRITKTPWMEWDNMVWYFENALKCKYRSKKWLNNNGHTSFANCVKYHGGSFAVWDRLGVWSASTKQALTPFLLLFSILTGANKTPLLEMQRDCIKEDALLGRKYVTWFKTRGSSIHRSWSPIARMIVERVMQITDGLAIEKGSNNNFLWLYYDNKGVRRIDTFHTRELHWFVKKYRLLADDGSALQVNVSRMRPTFASRAFEKSNGDLVKLRTLLNHRHIRTTQKYVRAFDKAKEDRRAFQGMTSILEGIRNNTLIKKYVAETKIASDVLLRDLKNHKYYTGLGNCLDPYRSPMKGEQAKKRCRLFWSCVVCRHVLILDTDLPEILSHYYKIEKFRAYMTADAFKEVYGFIQKIIDNDILPRFDNKIVAAAREKAITDPALSMDLHTMCIEEMNSL